MNRVQGMTCIVTGGAVGIGHACALRLAGEGAAVAIFDRLDAEGLALVDTITRAGGKAGYWHVDVTREADVARAIDEVADRFGGVDVLVNNAGISGSTRLTHEKSPRPSGTRCRRSTSRASCSAPSTRSRACAAQAGGSIINLSSIYGLVGAPDVPAYHASKGAVRLMSKTDALAYAPDRIRVNSVHPGYIWTPMVEHHLRASGATDLDAARDDVGKLHPLGHMGEPDDIAWGVVYLASDESRFVTGAELVIDGGYTAR